MPKQTAVSHPTDLDYDLASLQDPLTDDALEMLSTVIESRDYLNELLAYVGQAQAMLEAGHSPFEVNDRFGLDLDEVTEKLAGAVKWMVG